MLPKWVTDRSAWHRLAVSTTARCLDNVDADATREAARLLWEEAAALGDTEALRICALLDFHEHPGLWPNARRLFAMAVAASFAHEDADGGCCALSMNNLSVMMLESLGSAERLPPAGLARVLLVRSAAQSGSMLVQTNAAVAYYMGDGGAVDHVQARGWFARAAQQGEPIAACNLGLMALRGEGGAADAAEAREWLAMAAAHELSYEDVKELAAALSTAHSAAGVAAAPSGAATATKAAPLRRVALCVCACSTTFSAGATR